MTPRERLLTLAPLLWGERWQSEMAKEIGEGASRRTLSRYAHGRRPPEKLLQKLDTAAVFRIGALAAALGATPVILLPDGRILTFTPEGEPVEPEGKLETHIRSALEEVRDRMKGPANAAE